MKTLPELFEYELRQLYDSEHKIVKLLDRMAGKCSNDELCQVLGGYREFSAKRIARLEAIFEQAGSRPQRSPSNGINGLITEFGDFLETRPAAPILDLFAVEAARRVERYSICAYQALITLAVALERQEAVELLSSSLAEHNLAGGGFKALTINLTENLLTPAAE